MSRVVRASLLMALVAVVAVAASGSASGVVSPSPTADYRFLHSLVSSVTGAPDPPDLTDLGSGTNVFKKEKVTSGKQWVYTFPKSNGVQLTGTGGLIATDVYTIVVQFRFTDTGGYRRIIDLQSGSSDKGLYNHDGALVFYTYAPGASVVIQPNTYVMVALTRDAAGLLTGYVNGVQQFQVDDSVNQYGWLDGSNTLRFFRDDNVTPGEDSAGAVARIELFGSALSAADVAALPLAPPKPTLKLNPNKGPQGTTFTITGKNFGPTENVKITETDALAPACNDTTGFQATTAKDGSFTTSPVNYPTCPSGTTMKIHATGLTSGLKKAASFKITP